MTTQSLRGSNWQRRERNRKNKEGAAKDDPALEATPQLSLQGGTANDFQAAYSEAPESWRRRSEHAPRPSRR